MQKIRVRRSGKFLLDYFKRKRFEICNFNCIAFVCLYFFYQTGYVSICHQ
jgi:hypothetical protein